MYGVMVQASSCCECLPCLGLLFVGWLYTSHGWGLCSEILSGSSKWLLMLHSCSCGDMNVEGIIALPSSWLINEDFLRYDTFGSSGLLGDSI